MVGTTTRKWPAGIRPARAGIQIRVRRGGYNYEKTLPGDANKKGDLASAVRHRNEVISRIDLGLPLYAEERTAVSTFADDMQRYLDSLTDLAFSTVEGYVRDFNSFWLPVFGRHITQEITRHEIERVMNSWPVSTKTKINRLIPLRGVFEAARISPNPALEIRLQKRKKGANKNQVERFLPEERSAIMDELSNHAEPQIPAYFALLFGCGLRPSGEPLGLQWVDYDGEEIYIHRTIVRRKFKSTTKTDMARRVYVPSWVRPYIDRLPSRFKDGHLFLNSFDRPCMDADPFNDAWNAAFATKRLRRDLKIRHRDPYTCRHTRAAEMLSMGVKPGKAAGQLGHSLKMFFDTYAEFIDQYDQEKDNIKLEGVGVAENPIGYKLGTNPRNAS